MSTGVIEPAAAGPAPAHRGATPSAVRIFVLVVGIVVSVAALKLAKTVLIPLAAGLFLALVAHPMYCWLHERMPRYLKWLSLVLVMLVLLAVVGAFAGALTLSARAVNDEVQARRPQLQAQLDRLSAMRDRFALPGAGAGAKSSGDPPAAAPNAESRASPSSSLPSPARAVGVAAAGLGGLLLALAFAALGLAEADVARRRLESLRSEASARVLLVMREAAPAFRRYLWVKTLTSLLTGVVTGAAAMAFGLPLAWVWGFLAFLFEYVPTVGSLAAIVGPVLVALAEGGPSRAGLVLLVIGTAQIVLGNVVDPRLEGKMMAISPFGVLLSIVFWGWLWGAVGALLAVPLTVAVVIACRHIPSAHAVATMVSGDGVDERA